jgi:ribosome-associated protein
MAGDPLELARTIVATLEDRKAEDILLLDLTGICTFADLFVIATGGSERQLKALSDEVQRQLKLKFKLRSSAEGEASSGWILHDYGRVVLHLFSEQLREYYALEELWGEGKVLLRMA